VVADDRLYRAFLAQYDDEGWLRAIDRLAAAIHPVDRAATRIWFHLFPLRVQQVLEAAPDPAALARQLRLEGRWQLAEQRDSSHWFLFGHRYWDEACQAVRAFTTRSAPPGSLDLGAQVHEIAAGLAARLRVDRSWVLGITAVALRTFQQVGLSSPDTIAPPADEALIGGRETHPDRLCAQRTASGGGLFSFLAGRRREWPVRFDERRADGGFPLIASQHLTTAAARDTRDHRAADARCSEGPIPVHCRSCSCGTCWVGIIDGAERLSAVEPRERATIAALGYLASDEPRPVIRLACMAQAEGPITLVVPPWNGQVGARLEKARRGGDGA
jgi:ferredoxin